jgi:hypothetical protein
MVIKKEMMVVMVLMMFVMSVLPAVSAGVGIKWDKESVLVNEGGSACFSYSVYNPWPKEAYVTIEVSEELESVITAQEAETKLVPADTSSDEAIPVEFCFKVPTVYEEDCLVGGMLCEQTCGADMVSYSGEILVREVPAPAELSGAGGSATSMSVSAPLNLKVSCNAHSRNFTVIYAILAVISLIVIGFFWKKKKGEKKTVRKPAKKSKKKKK